jgi:hypothetical protein
MAMALSIGPTEPLGRMKWSVSAEDSYTFERDLEIADALTAAEIKDVNQAYTKITLGLNDYFNVYAKIGATTGGKYSFTDTTPATYDYETSASLLWGLGLSGTYKLPDPTWKLIGDIQYSAWNEDVDKATYNGAAGSNIINPEIQNSEFQLTGILSKDFDAGNETVFTPYLGVAYVYYKTETDGTITYTVPAGTVTNAWSLEGDSSVSGIAGLGVKLYKNWKAYLEGRFGAEGGVSGGLNYNF